MVGVVLNHMGRLWPDITQVETFPDASYYHNCDRCHAAGGGKDGVGCNGTICDCWVDDYDNVEQQLYCQLFGLPDLNQSHPVTRQRLNDFAVYTKQMGFDAVRIDTVPYVADSFWSEWVGTANMFSMGETSTGVDAKVASHLTNSRMDSAINYPLYYTLDDCFVHGESLKKLQQRLAAQRRLYGSLSMSLMGNFAENHDEPRLASKTIDLKRRQAFVLYTLAAQGLGIIYYGQEQSITGAKLGGPDEAAEFRKPLWISDYRTDDLGGMYAFTVRVNKLRQLMPRDQFADTEQYERYVSDSLYVFQRGQVVVALTNTGSRVMEQRQLVTNLPSMWKAGTRICNALVQGDCSTLSADYQLEIYLLGGESKLYTLATYAEAL
eukprot:1170872-Prymnesium_polylepis.1